MYHCFDVVVADLAVSIIALATHHLREDLREHAVEPPEIEAEEDGGRAHDRGRVVDFLLGGPGVLLELGLVLGEERASLGELARAPPHPSRQPGRSAARLPRQGPRGGAVVARLLHLPRLCDRHGFHPLSRPGSKVAGQEGLEPPTPGFGDRCSTIELLACVPYFVSLWSVCLRHELQYLLFSRRSVVFFLFFVVT